MEDADVRPAGRQTPVSERYYKVWLATAPLLRASRSQRSSPGRARCRCSRRRSTRRRRRPPAPSFPSEPIWTVDLQATPVGAPLASSDHVFVPLQGSLSARRLADGGEAWLAKLELAGVPAASPDYLIVPAKESLQILRAASGEVVWSERTPAVTAQPLVAGGQLIVATGDTLTSYTLADGAKRWTREVGPMDQRPAVADDQLYVPVTDGRLLALNLGTGETIWEADPRHQPDRAPDPWRSRLRRHQREAVRVPDAEDGQRGLGEARRGDGRRPGGHRRHARLFRRARQPAVRARRAATAR